jgi:hypothetical protein
MVFPESVIIRSFIRSDGRCECRRDHPEHRGHGRCKARFSRDSGWQAHRLSHSATATFQNCELLCPECFDLTEASWTPEAAVAARS